MAKKAQPEQPAWKVHQPDLLAALNAVTPAISRTSYLQVIKSVKLECTADGRLSLIGTDLEWMLSASLMAVGEGAFQVVLPAKTLTDWIKLADPQELVELTLLPNHTMKLRSGRSTAAIKGIDPKEFPLSNFTPRDETAVVARFLGDDFARLVERTAVVAAKDDSRPMLQALMINLDEDGQVCMATTDGFRLLEGFGQATVTVHKRDGRRKAPLFWQVLPHAKHMLHLARLVKALGVNEVQMLLGQEEEVVYFDLGAIQARVTIISGQYPDYNPIVKPIGNYRYCYTVERARLLAGLKVADIFAREGDRLTYLTFDVQEGQQLLTLQTRATESGSGQNIIRSSMNGATRPTDKPFTMAVNCNYLAEGLRAVDADILHFHVRHATDPLGIRAADDGHWLYLVMPMTTDNAPVAKSGEAETAAA